MPILKKCCIKGCYNRIYGKSELFCILHQDPELLPDTKPERAEYTYHSGSPAERRNLARKKWRELNKQKHNASTYASVEKWRKRFPEKRRVYDIVRFHKSKLIVLYECLHDTEKENHHPDYSKPLEVWRVCKPCHREMHRRAS
jgi:hypothetical protein